jgi:hypothetical protein
VVSNSFVSSVEAARRPHTPEKKEMNNSAIIGGKSCRSCMHRRMAGQETFCYRYPPTVLLVPMPGPKGQVAPGFQSAYPAVNPDMPCGEYARSEVFASEEVQTSVLGETRQ